MDVGRSCFVRPFHFFLADGSPVPVAWVRWYFAPDGALPIPGGSIWGSTVWNDIYEDAASIVGEIPKPVKTKFTEPVWSDPKYNKGAIALGVDGLHYCGTLVDFHTAKVFSDDLPTLARGPGGASICCNPALGASIGLRTTSIPSATIGLEAPAPANYSYTLVLRATPPARGALGFTFTTLPKYFVKLFAWTFPKAQIALAGPPLVPVEKKLGLQAFIPATSPLALIGAAVMPARSPLTLIGPPTVPVKNTLGLKPPAVAKTKIGLRSLSAGHVYLGLATTQAASGALGLVGETAPVATGRLGLSKFVANIAHGRIGLAPGLATPDVLGLSGKVPTPNMRLGLYTPVPTPVNPLSNIGLSSPISAFPKGRLGLMILGGGGGVTTPCCPSNATPNVLHLTLIGVGSFVLTYNVVSGAWQGSGYAFTCGASTGFWTLKLSGITQCTFGATFQPGNNCGPFFLTSDAGGLRSGTISH